MPIYFHRFSRSYYDRRIDLALIHIMSVYLRTKWVDILYKVATGSKKVRNLLTPVGAIFFAFFITLFIALNVWELKAIEEPELAKRLGEAYLEYKKNTPMFIPNFRQ